MKEPRIETLVREPTRHVSDKAGLLVGDPTDLTPVEILMATAARQMAVDAVAEKEISTAEPGACILHPPFKDAVGPSVVRPMLSSRHLAGTGLQAMQANELLQTVHRHTPSGHWSSGVDE